MKNTAHSLNKLIEELLQNGKSVAIGTFSVDGQLIHANKAMCFFLDTDQENLQPKNKFVNPTFSNLIANNNSDLIFDGLITIGNLLDVSYVLSSKVFRKDDEILIFAEADVPMLFEANNKMSLLNQEVNNLERQLIKDKNTLQTTLAKLEQQKVILKESEERFQLLFNKAPLGYQSLDLNGNFIDINQKWIDTLGYEREEVIGKWFGDFLTPLYQDGFRKRFPIFKAQGHIHSEFEMVHKNGSILFIAFDGKIGNNLDGNFKQTHCILQDVTQQRKAEKKLAESEEKFRNLFEHSVVGKSITTIDGKLNANKAFSEILGYTESELQNMNWRDITHPDDIELNTSYVNSILKDEKQSIRWEKRYIHKDGHVVWTDISTILQRDSDGNPLYFISELIDITDKKIAENELNISRTEFIDLYENAPVGYHEIDSSGRIVRMNKTELNMLGYKIEEVANHYFWEFFQDEKVSKINIQAKLEGISIPNFPYEREFARKDGVKVLVLVQDKILYNNEGKITGIRSTVQDITERKKAEIALQESELFFKESQKAAGIGSYKLDFRTGLWSSSEVLDNIFGIDNNYIRSVEGWLNIVFDDDKEMMNQHFSEEVMGKRRKFDKVYRIKKISTGEVIWVHGLGKLTFDENNLLVTMIGTIQDITSRMKIEKALKISEARNSSIIETAMEGFWRVDKTGKILEVNNSMCRITGYSDSELLTMSVSDIEATENQEDVENHIKLVFTHGTHRFETKHRRKDGRIIDLEVSLQLVNENDGQVVAFFRDITERKKHEKETLLNIKRQEAIVEILQYKTDSVQDYLDFALSKAISMTESKLGYIYNYNEDNEEFVLNSWSNEVMNECKIVEKQTVYQLHFTGLWGEAVRQRKPIMVNDFQSPHPLKKGYPEGHAPLYNYLTLPVFNNNKIVAVIGVANKKSDYNTGDITQLTVLMDIVWKTLEKFKTDKALQNSEEKFRKAFITSPESITITSIEDGTYKDVNSGFTLITGYTYDEVIGKKSTEIDIWCNISDRNYVINSLKQNGVVENYVCQFKTKSGAIIFGMLSATTIELDGENHVLLITRDITKIKTIEHDLLESNNRLNLILENTPIAIWDWDVVNDVWYTTPKYYTMLGYEPVTGNSDRNIWINRIHPEDKQFVSKKTANVLQHKEENYRYDARMLHADGTYRWQTVIGQVVERNSENKVTRLIGVRMDINERKLAEIALRESEELLSLYIKNSPIYSFIKEVSETESKVLYASENFIDMIGIPGHEMTGKTMYELFPPEFAKIMTEDDWNVHNTNEVLKLDENLNDRNYFTIKFPIAQGHRNLLAGFTIDITERKKTENDLRKSEEKLTALFNGMSEMTVIHDLILDDKNQPVNYRIIDCNDAFTQITGIKRENAIGKLATEVYSTEQAPYLSLYSSVCISGRNLEYRTYFEPMDKHFLISAVSIGKNRFATITADITDIQKAQEAISEKNKELENYLYVASHDLRSPLVNIQGFSQRLNKQITQLTNIVSELNISNEIAADLSKFTTNEIPKSLNFIQNNVDKMDILINGLLQVSRTGRVLMNIANLDMNKLFQTISGIFDYQLKEINASIIIHNVENCYGDINQLNQLFSNIIGNAIKYRDNNRKLVIDISSKVKYNKVIYCIKDTGIGINKRHIERIWDVFYRVDASGTSGEGLGLSIAKRIADKHKGKIWVESVEGEGSQFFVELHINKYEE